MRSTEIKDKLMQLVEADPDGLGLLRDMIGKKELGRVMAHAAGWLNATLSKERDALGEILNIVDTGPVHPDDHEPSDAEALDQIGEIARAVLKED